MKKKANREVENWPWLLGVWPPLVAKAAYTVALMSVSEGSKIRTLSGHVGGFGSLPNVGAMEEERSSVGRRKMVESIAEQCTVPCKDLR